MMRFAPSRMQGNSDQCQTCPFLPSSDTAYFTIFTASQPSTRNPPCQASSARISRGSGASADKSAASPKSPLRLTSSYSHLYRRRLGGSTGFYNPNNRTILPKLSPRRVCRGIATEVRSVRSCRHLIPCILPFPPPSNHRAHQQEENCSIVRIVRLFDLALVRDEREML